MRILGRVLKWLAISLGVLCLIAIVGGILRVQGRRGAGQWEIRNDRG